MAENSPVRPRTRASLAPRRIETPIRCGLTNVANLEIADIVKKNPSAINMAVLRALAKLRLCLGEYLK
ncbi:MAG: hypothetical protein HC794_08590 [Nitrospiraceae bacterium]|nr:hypothetical protein [Nitrospiraceae bacterium]